MVSNYPNCQMYDYRQMYTLPFLKKNDKIYPLDSLMGVISTNPDLFIFTQLIKKTNYENKLSNSQADFTVFVPSDQLLKKKYTTECINSIDRGTATQILDNSIMNRKIDKKLLQSDVIGRYPTISRNNSLEFTTINDKTTIQKYIDIIHFNQPASNGIIHIVSDFIKPYQTSFS